MINCFTFLNKVFISETHFSCNYHNFSFQMGRRPTCLRHLQHLLEHHLRHRQRSRALRGRAGDNDHQSAGTVDRESGSGAPAGQRAGQQPDLGGVGNCRSGHANH